MLAIRYSQAMAPNDSLRSMPAQRRESNRAWLERLGATSGIILSGGSSLAHFRIRVAQSHVRSDLLPSFWSLVGILEDGHTFASVPFDGRTAPSIVPSTNGVQTCRLEEYDDPVRFPNIAVVQFTDDERPIQRNIDRVRSERSVIDLPTLMLPWLGYIWSVGQAVNPLLAGQGLPSAAFVEMVYGIAGIELTPCLLRLRVVRKPSGPRPSGGISSIYGDEVGARGMKPMRPPASPPAILRFGRRPPLSSPGDNRRVGSQAATGRESHRERRSELSQRPGLQVGSGNLSDGRRP